MIVDPVTMRPGQKICEALDVMANFKISGVPVTDDAGRLVGILTNRDLRFETNLERPISDLMTKKDLVTVPPGTTLEEAKSLLHKHRIEKLLVVDGGNLTGLITVKDIQKMTKYPNACKDELGRLRVAGRGRCRWRFPRPRPGVGKSQGDVLVLDSSHGHKPRRAGRRGHLARATPRSAPGGGQCGHRAGCPRRDRTRRRRCQDRHRPGLDLHHASRHRRRRTANHGHPGLRAGGHGSRCASHRRRWHQVLGRPHQGHRRRRPRHHDRLALCRHRGEPGRDHPLPGAHLQGLPRHGLALGHGQGQRRPLFPGLGILAREARARGHRRHGALQGQRPPDDSAADRRAALRHGAGGVAPTSTSCVPSPSSSGSRPPGSRKATPTTW